MRIRFRLRTLLLAAVVLALPLRWCGCHRERDRQLEDRVAAIEGHGGQVMFDPANELPSLDEQLWRNLGGDERRGRSAYVVLAGSLKSLSTRMDDDNLLALDLANFPLLGGLCLDGCSVGDRGIANLAAVPNLKELSLARTAISDNSLKSIARFTRLETLDLSGTNVTDAGVCELKSLKRLEVLSIRDTKATKAVVAELHAALPETLINHNAKR
jgi:hypothetical protein